MQCNQVSQRDLFLAKIQRWYARKLWAQALSVQVVSLLVILCLSNGLLDTTWVFELKQSGLPLDSLAFWLLVHLLLVNLMTKLIEMPIWWRWIQVGFPLAVAVMQVIQIPTSVYLIGFVFTLVLYWSVHTTRVPFYPSFPATWRAMLYVCDQHAAEQSLRVLDIGSGLGDVALFLAKHRLQDDVAGIEIAPLPWGISWLRAKLGGSAASFHLGDYRLLDFSQRDVILAYLSPAVMTDVWQKVQHEMHPGSLFVSSEFPVEGVTPTRTLFPSPQSPVLYVYTV